MNAVATRKPMWLRIAQFPPLRLAMFGTVMFYMLGYSNKFIGETAGSPLLQIAVVIGWSAVGFAIYIGLVRLIERRPVTELALPGMGRELGIGLLVGAGLYTACILVLMVMGIYRIDGLNPVSYLLPAIALPLSSGIRRLWMSMGFHIAWNYTQSGVFSGTVSGGETDPGLIKPIIDGPTLLTGGTFGVESSIIAFALCTATGVVLLIMAVRRGHIVPPFWRQRAQERAEHASG